MSTYSKCPKCKFTAKSSFSECPRCGVIVSKFLRKAKADKQADSRDAASKNSDLQNLARANALVIRQQKEWGEILTGFETKNRYDVMDHQNNPLIEALEEGDSAMATITRLFLKALRPFTMHLFSPGGTGLFKESFTDADNFGITFPPGIDLSQKALLLGAVFLIDFVHFENSGNRN
jgi:hypothetical protein